MKTNITPATMNANETKNANIAHAEGIYKKIESIRMRSAWNNGVKEYALMLLDWYIEEANDHSIKLETMLNGAKDWKQYAFGGCGVAKIWDTDIAETLCTPSELRRTKGGLKAPNARETWQDVEARALYQAYFLIQKFNKK